MATPRKIRCTVSEILPHGSGVYTLRLTPERPLPSFLAGQFCHLAIDEYDPSGFWPESRAFSIASHPAQREQLEIVYSVVGCFTGRMERELRVGSTVWAKLPYGEFVVQAPGDLVFIAGGTGISAFISFLRDFSDSSDSSRRVHLIYGARKPELLLFANDLLECGRRNPALQLLFTAEQEGQGRAALPCCQLGRISVDLAWQTVQQPLGATYFLSGPPAMIRSLREQLQSRGVAPERVCVDAWE